MHFYFFFFQMPGVDQMQGYNMRYGRSPIMELPLAINPTGCARSEPLLRTHFKRYVVNPVYLDQVTLLQTEPNFV